MATYELTVNGRKQAVTADPGTPLLWVLRDDLKMTGTKYGCGIAACGACTVHVGGVATRSCAVTLADAEGQEVVTVEGLSPDGNHPVQVAWRELTCRNAASARPVRSCRLPVCSPRIP